ncbi:MAG: hypothetical protein JNJ45_06015 [Chthonomonas sp.]|nr:hypothetical protein [Chthonomonas sp.]
MDQLIAAAFGELSAQETARLESGLDAEGQATMVAFAKMRAAMGQLPDPGPCQVSPEMLRDRILNAGVQTRSPWALWLPRVGLGGLAAVLGFVVMNSLTKPNESPVNTTTPVQVATSKPAPKPIVVDTTPELEPAPLSTGAILGPDRPIGEADVRDEPRRVVRKVRRAETPVVKEQSKAVAEAKLDGVGSDTARGAAFGGSAPTAPMIAAEAAPLMSEPTVVIVDAEEGEVGAPVAIEVSAATEDVGIKG